MNEMVPQDKLLSLAHRGLNSQEPLETVAKDHGVSEADLKRTVREYKKTIEKLQREEERKGQLADLVPGLLKMAVDFRINGRSLRAKAEYRFKFPELCDGDTHKKGPTKFYRPDVVWFNGEPSEETASVIFEIENGTSPKHQMGGLAFANILALKYTKTIMVLCNCTRGIGDSLELNCIIQSIPWAKVVSKRFRGPRFPPSVSGGIRENSVATAGVKP